MNDQESPERFSVIDYLYWAMMLFVNMPQVLELAGIDTIFKPYRACALVLAILMIPRMAHESEATRPISRLLFVALVYASIMTIIFGGEQMFAQVPLVGSIVILYLASFAVSSRKSLMIGLKASIASFFVSAYLGLLGFNSGEYRLTGLFENPNAIGLGGCFVLLIAINRGVSLPKWARLSIGVFLLPVIVLTGSRNAIVGLLACFMSQTWRNPKLFYGLAIAGLVLGSSLILFEREIAKLSNRAVFTRLTSREVIMRGGAGRLAVAKTALKVGLDHAFVGIGFGQYREQHHAKYFRDRRDDGKIRKLGTHNFYATLLTEWGFVGFMCFAMVFYRLAKASEGLEFERDFIIGFLAITMLISIGHDMVGMIHFWVYLGVSVQLLRFSYEDQLKEMEEYEAPIMETYPGTNQSIH